MLEKASGSLCSWLSLEISNSRGRVDRGTLSQKHTNTQTNGTQCPVPSLALRTGWLDLNAIYRDEQVNSDAHLHSGGRTRIVDTHCFDESGKRLPGKASGIPLMVSEKPSSGLNTEFNP